MTSGNIILNSINNDFLSFSLFPLPFLLFSSFFLFLFFSYSSSTSFFSVPFLLREQLSRSCASYILFISRWAPSWGFIKLWATSVHYWNLLLRLSLPLLLLFLLLLCLLLSHILSLPLSRCFYPRNSFFFYFCHRLFPRLPADWTQKETISQSLPPSLFTTPEADRIRFIQFTR